MGELRWPVTSAVVVGAAVLGFIGLGQVKARSGQGALPLADRFFDTFLLFKMSNPYSPPYPVALEVARWLAPATIIYAALRAAGAIFAQQWSEVRARLFYRGHVIVCGLGNSGLRLGSSFREKGLQVVVIEKGLSATTAPVGVDECQARGMTVLGGDATDPYVLSRAGVRRAWYLVAVCGDDGTNAEVALAARRSLSELATRKGGLMAGGRCLRCFVQVGDDRLSRLMEESAWPTRCGRVPPRIFQCDAFGLEGSSRRARRCPRRSRAASPPCRCRVRSCRPPTGGGGVQALVAAAGGAERCHLTLVAPDAPDVASVLHERLPGLRAACELQPCSADPSDPESPVARRPVGARQGRCLAFICSDNDDAAAVRAAIVVRRALVPAIGVIVCVSGHSAVPSLLGASSALLPNVSAFGLLDRACRADVLLNGVPEELAQSVHADYVRRRKEELARWIHTDSVRRRQGEGRQEEPDRPEGLRGGDDPALAPWEELPERPTGVEPDQAADIGRKLAMIGCHLEPTSSWDAEPRGLSAEEVDLLSRAEHDRWCEERRRNGWQYGERRDVAKKQNPDLVAWEDLTERSRDLGSGHGARHPTVPGPPGLRRCSLAAACAYPRRGRRGHP